MIEKIICSAVHIIDGQIHKNQPINVPFGLIVCGRRHGDCITTVEELNPRYALLIEQKDMGFLTNLNRFVDRREGMKIAIAANQLLFPEYHAHKKEDDELFLLTSEDLYPYDEREKAFL